MSQKKRTCSICRKKKSPKEFYGPGTCCRSCTKIRVKLWAKNNPERRRKNLRKYQTSAKGRATTARFRALWRPRNTASERAQNQRYIARLPDAYLRKQLKARGIISPTPEQIERQRVRVQIIRARKILSLIAYGPRKQH